MAVTHNHNRDDAQDRKLTYEEEEALLNEVEVIKPKQIALILIFTFIIHLAAAVIILWPRIQKWMSPEPNQSPNPHFRSIGVTEL